MDGGFTWHHRLGASSDSYELHEHAYPNSGPIASRTEARFTDAPPVYYSMRERPHLVMDYTGKVALALTTGAAPEVRNRSHGGAENGVPPNTHQHCNWTAGSDCREYSYTLVQPLRQSKSNY